MRPLLVAALMCLCREAYPQNTMVPLGIMADFTGPAAAFGDECRQGVEAAIAVQSNSLAAAGYRLKPIYADAAGEPRKAVSEFKKLVAADKIAALVAVRSNVALALNPLAEAVGVSLLALAGHEDLFTGGNHTFRFWSTVSDEAKILVEYLRTKGIKEAALLTIEEDYPLSLRGYFKQFLLESGGRIVFDEVVPPLQAGEESASALVIKARAAKPDVFFINADVAQSGVLVRKVRQLGIKSQLVSNFRVRDPAIAEVAGKGNLEGLIFVETVFDQPRFKEALSKVAPSPRAGANSYNCFAATAAASQALLMERPSPDGLNAALFRGLLTLSQIDMPDGALKFQGREAKAPLSLRVFRSGVPTAL